MKKNYIKAVAYSIGGFIVALSAFFGMLYMYFSATFLPVYVKGIYVTGNRIVRIELYLILFIVIILAVGLSAYGIKYLTKKFHKNKRRH